jgi:hypothetical protein
MSNIYEEVMSVLKVTNEKLWQTLCIRLCRVYLEQKKYKPLEEVEIKNNIVFS